MTPLTLKQAREVARNLAAVEEAVGEPAAHWGGRCHEISLKVLRTKLFGPGRIARGWAKNVSSQHSWIILGDDCYDLEAVLVDPTIGPLYDNLAIGTGLNEMTSHVPHGAGNIWQYGGPPDTPTGAVIELPGYDNLSSEARTFLDIAGYPFDYRGWCQLASSPVQGWPAAEIIAAIYQTPVLRHTVPVDHVGMLTALNPKELYW